MRQSLHIFRKDARYLRIEIGLFLLVSAIYAWAGARQTYPIGGPAWLLAIAAIFLIARVVHAEPIPGDHQFWVTRPYHRLGLAGAKLLFIAAFVCAPICAAQIVILVAGGFPLLSAVPGLFWAQALIFFVGSILVAALASITSGTVLFMLSVLLLTAVGWIAEFTFPILIPTNALYRFPEPSALGWVREYVALALLALTGAFILHRQYRDRATTLSRAAGIVGICLAVSAFLWLPSSFAYAVQSSVTKPLASANSVQASVDPALKSSGAEFVKDRDPQYRRVRIPLPIVVRGVPEGFVSRVDALSVSFQWPGKQPWKPDVSPGVNPRSTSRGVSLEDGNVLMDSGLYRENRAFPLILTGAVYITLFGETQTRTVTLRDGLVNMQDGLQCFVDLDNLICRSVFRWPARLVSAESPSGHQYTFLNTMISYSPFPADASLELIRLRPGGDSSAGQMTLTTQKPLAHFWRRFQIRGIRLTDFEGPEPPFADDPKLP